MTCEACRITAVETAIVSLPLPRPVVTPVHHITTVDNILVTVRTDAGLEGIAYLWCFGPKRAKVVAAMVDELADHARGQDALQTVTLWDRLWRENNFFGRAGVAMLAHSALDIACWDIKGRAAGQPVWQLLGGTAKPIPTYAGGLFLSDPLDAIVEEARGYARQGFRAMKMRAGLPRLADDIERFAAVRDAIGPDVQLMIDAVQAWTADDAIRACNALARFDITWIEDPVAFDDHDGLARVAAHVPMPLCAGENDYSRLGFQRLIRGGCIRIAMPDLQRVGGITEWMRVAALADANGLRVTPHAFHELSLHVMCAVPNGFWLEYVPWWERLFVQVPELVDGCMAPPRGPGLGLQFDWDGLDAHRVT
ncbi:MAG TPA: mandelate racemase/muconate lactonizing enzyme family protein [Ramlibacter sp.]|nr:mandelate racemase/muconate lactonizing enzyme family protein [Ramlibacter sp.]